MPFVVGRVVVNVRCGAFFEGSWAFAPLANMEPAYMASWFVMANAHLKDVAAELTFYSA